MTRMLTFLAAVLVLVSSAGIAQADGIRCWTSVIRGPGLLLGPGLIRGPDLILGLDPDTNDYVPPPQAILLEGRQVKVEYLYPNANTIWGTNGEVTYVAPGPELPSFAIRPDNQLSYLSIDLSDTNIRITNNLDAKWSEGVAFNGLHFQDVYGDIAAFARVTVNDSSTMTGFTPSMITFDADNIWINWPGVSGSAGQFVSLDLVPLPEPSMIASLGGIALAGLGLVLRRWRRAA